jgi:hypothetical protein
MVGLLAFGGPNQDPFAPVLARALRYSGGEQEPFMIKITGINHIAIATPAQLAEMRRFYVDVLGIASVRARSRRCWRRRFQAPGSTFL